MNDDLVLALLNQKEHYIGFPEVGAVLIQPDTLDRIQTWIQNTEQFLDTYLTSHSYEGSSLIAVNGVDLTIEKNERKAGPTYSETNLPFAYVLCKESKFESQEILFANNPKILTWAAVEFVYAELDLNTFFDRLFFVITN